MYAIRRARRVRRLCATVLGTALLLTVVGCSGDEEGDGERQRERAGGPAVGKGAPFWVNPNGSAARQVEAYEREGREAEAEVIRRIAEQPAGEWVGTSDPEGEARALTEAAVRADRRALLVLYNIPHRDCGNYSGGGALDGNAYRSWLEAVMRGIGDRPATVVLEPDAVLHLVDGCTPAEFHEERYALLDEAVTRLKGLRNTKVYLDAGNAGWGRPEQIWEPLRRAGVEKADGFAVNVSNFYSTADSIAYGKSLSAKVGGRHFVVDTSRNGNGPYEEGDPGERWCNPPGRALGETPTTSTADPLVDAYVWAKRPGESDGTCKGGPKAGEWWPEYALALARASG
ncbi:glycoside hydrolase family 6 protein [Streptomyces sp. UH6]|uniref:glycoside hydrolase family 6 protein n=1 Tax=Streptomyces sp. UH6 TaxID=2748379 RepID=UPI0015D4BF01|nr:glycoside hydrolase family 6 protein [Streptomyces sp. UH6]NYV77226.1 glycoside hydrolase family 6 protein [Streptomyces sp. UH6]